MLFTNSFEQGTSGTNITTANSGNPSAPFDITAAGSGATLAYDNAHAAHGSLAAKSQTTTGVTNAWAGWSTSFPSWTATVYFRAYFYWTANPASNVDLIAFQDSSGSLCGKFRLTAGGKITLLDATQSNHGTSTNTVPLNAWFRMDGFLTGSATAGQLQVSIYTGSGGDSTTALETVTSPATLGTNTVPGQVHYGHAATGQANIGPFWWDDVALSDSGTLIGWADYLSAAGDTGSGTDGGTGPSGGTHELVGITNAGG